jgi:16S rRNA (guanine966-N2)-methyltransferase
LGSPADQFFLDLFAGSGSVGLEAASRQAKTVAFVEKSKALIGVIRDNVSLCGYSEKCLVIHADIQSALRDLYGKKCRFDVIFADPPYNRGMISETLKVLKEYPVLQRGGIIVLQHSVREKLTPLPDGWSVADQRKYGDNLLTFIRMAVHDAREIRKQNRDLSGLV